MKKYLELHPTADSKRIEMIEFLYSLGDFEIATKQLNILFNKNIFSADIIETNIKIQSALEDKNNYFEALKEAGRNCIAPPIWLKALSLANQHKTNDAELILTQQINKFPNDFKSHFYLIKLHEQNKNWLSSFNECLSLYQKNPKDLAIFHILLKHTFTRR